MMLDFQQKRKVKSIMYNRITLGILAVLVLIVLHSTWTVYLKEKESSALKDVSLARVEELRGRNLELQGKIDKLATVSGVEEEIRTKFSVAKDNESMVVIVPGDEIALPATSTPPSFLHRVNNFFFGK
mgnify:FL=1